MTYSKQFFQVIKLTMYVATHLRGERRRDEGDFYFEMNESRTCAAYCDGRVDSLNVAFLHQNFSGKEKNKHTHTEILGLSPRLSRHLFITLIHQYQSLARFCTGVGCKLQNKLSVSLVLRGQSGQEETLDLFMPL